MTQPAGGVGPEPRPSLLREIDLRPALLPACAFIAGIILHEYFPQLDPAAIVLACVCLVAAPLAFFLTRGRVLLLVVAVMLATTCGFLRHACRHDVLAPDDVSRLVPAEGALMRVRGVLVTRPWTTETRSDGTFHLLDSTRTRFHLAVDSVRTRKGWEPASGRVQVNCYERLEGIGYGDRIEMLSRCTYPDGPSSPGEFDYRKYLLRQGIRLRTGVAHAAAIRVLSREHGNFLLGVGYAMGERLGRVINECHGPAEAGFLRCVLLGERGAVDQETERSFRLSGLTHILAVSGMQVAGLMVAIWFVLRFLLVPERLIALIVMAAAVLYSAMADFEPSVVRAMVGSLVVASGPLTGRRPDSLNLLALAAVIILVANPDDVFSAGFQLSFLAVVGLVTLTGPLAKALEPWMAFRGADLLPGARSTWRLRANHALVALLALSIAASLATQALVTCHFRVVNGLSPVINLLMVPFFSVVFLGGFLALLLEMIFGGFPVALVSGGLAKLMMWGTAASAKLPGAWVNAPSPPAWMLMLYYAALVFVAAAPFFRVRRRVAAAALVAVVCGMGVWEFAPTGLKSPEIAVLDVGGGSSVVVRSSDGRSALVDAGTFGSLDIARWTVLPYLIESRCRSLDYVILSHAHADHISGLPELVSNFRVKKVLLGESFELSRAGARVERFLIDSGIPFDYVAAGDNVSLGDVTIQIMHPPRDRKLLNQWDENGRSSAVRGGTPRGTFILFADVTGTGLQYLSQHADLSADVVLAAHHGGQSGMETTSWRWPLVLFSARTGFVKPERLESYRKAGSRVLTTCDNGTIVVRFAERIEVQTFGGRKPATGGGK